MNKFKAGQRVDAGFLGEGEVQVIYPYLGYMVMLDKKAPNEYAWETNEVLLFAEDLELITKKEN